MDKEQFESGISDWYKMTEHAHQEAKRIISESRDEVVNLQDCGEDSLDKPYAIISLDDSVYLRTAFISSAGEVCATASYGKDDRLCATASYDKDDRRCPVAIEWDDISHDPIILSDFMHALYATQKSKEKISSFDVCLSPVVNVWAHVEDPYQLTEEEIEKITELAQRQILENASEKLSGENLEFITLYEEDVNDRPLASPVTLYNVK